MIRRKEAMNSFDEIPKDFFIEIFILYYSKRHGTTLHELFLLEWKLKNVYFVGWTTQTVHFKK
jgi:hypothetical protein